MVLLINPEEVASSDFIPSNWVNLKNLNLVWESKVIIKLFILDRLISSDIYEFHVIFAHFFQLQRLDYTYNLFYMNSIGLSFVTRIVWHHIISILTNGFGFIFMILVRTNICMAWCKWFVSLDIKRAISKLTTSQRDQAKVRGTLSIHEFEIFL